MATRSARSALAGALSVLSLAWVVAAAPSGALATPNRSPIVPRNENVGRMVGNQNEQTVAINPTNTRNIVVTSNLDAGSASPFEGLMEAYTFDGGHTWTSRIIGTGHDGMGLACCDSTLAFDQYGNLFLSYLFDRAGIVPVYLSTDGGLTFTLIHSIRPSPGLILGGPVGPSKGAGPGQASADQQTVTVGAGSVWLTYSSFSATTLVVQAAGASVTGLGQVSGWVGPESVPTGNGSGDYGDVAIGPDGEVTIVYQNPTGGEGPADVFVAQDPDGVGPARFGIPKLLTESNVGGFDYIPAQQERSIDVEANLAWNRFQGNHSGRLYAVWTSETPDESNNTDIMFQWSDDAGTTWSPAVRLNNDSGVNSQFMPAIAVDQTNGNVAISWFDARNDLGDGKSGDTDGIANTDTEMWGTYSLDGGVTFAPNFRISRGVSNATASGSFLDYGDYTHATFVDGQFWPVWADNSNSTGDNPDGTLGAMDVYTAKVLIP